VPPPIRYARNGDVQLAYQVVGDGPIDDAVGSERAALLGISEGGPMSSLFAASHPDRTSALVLYGTYARILRAPDHPEGLPRAMLDRFLEMTSCGWGGPVAIRPFAPSMADDERFLAWWARVLRMGTSPRGARDLVRGPDPALGAERGQRDRRDGERTARSLVRLRDGSASGSSQIVPWRSATAAPTTVTVAARLCATLRASAVAARGSGSKAKTRPVGPARRAASSAYGPSQAPTSSTVSPGRTAAAKWASTSGSQRPARTSRAHQSASVSSSPENASTSPASDSRAWPRTRHAGAGQRP